MNIPQFGIGIDTARYGHHVSFLNEEKRTAHPAFHFRESHDGYQKLSQVVEKLRRKHPQAHLHVRIDVAGQYAENLIAWLHQLEPLQAGPHTISVGQPAKNAAYRKVHYEKRKADPAESTACARYAVVEKPPATPFNPPAFARLRECVALLEASAKQRTRLVNQLHALLAKSFPELAVLVTNLSSGWVLQLLQKYPTADKLARARDESIRKIPRIPSGMAAKLQSAAKASTASSSGLIAEELVAHKVREIQQEKQNYARLEKLVEKALEQLPAGPHIRIRSIPGIGVQTSAALICKIVSIDRFETAKQLVGYFGIFPEEVDVSGTDKQGNPKQAKCVRMSRKGNDLVRRLLYVAAQSASRHNPAVEALYARQCADGKHYNTVIGHCMAKLLRQVFALWKYDRDFDATFAEETVTAQ